MLLGQEGVRWLSSFLPVGMVQKLVQQAQQAVALAYARPYTALTAVSGSIVVIGLLMHNRNLRAQLRASNTQVKNLEGTLAKVSHFEHVLDTFRATSAGSIHHRDAKLLMLSRPTKQPAPVVVISEYSVHVICSMSLPLPVCIR